MNTTTFTKFYFLFLFFFYVTSGFSQTSSNMTKLGDWNSTPDAAYSGVKYNDCWGYTSPSGREYAVLGGTKKIFFFEITSNTPTLIYTHTENDQGIWRDFKSYQNYMYASMDGSTGAGEGLLVFDLSNIDGTTNRVVKVAQKNGASHFNDAHNLFIDVPNARLYVAGDDIAASDLMVYDLSTPANPTKIANMDLPGNYVHDVYVRNNIAYCSHGNNGLYIYDVSGVTVGNPNGWVLKDSYVTGGYNHSSWLTANGTYLVYAEEQVQGRPMGILNVSDPTNISLVTTFKSPLNAPGATGVTPHNPFIVGDRYVVISYYMDGVVIFDISTAPSLMMAAPVRVAHYDTYPDNGSTYPTASGGTEGCWGTYPFFPSGKIIGSDITYGLFVFSTLSALPVELSNFRAIPSGRKVKLEWSTRSELNNEYFSVERSQDGKRFEEIGKVKGNGTTSIELGYDFTDAAPFMGTSYYRLKQVDFDGKSEYSRIVSVSLSKKASIRISPNLVNGKTPITISMENLDAANSVQVNVVDLAGRVLQTENWGIVQEESKQLSLTNLTSGVYFVHVSNGKTQLKEKIIVME